LYDNHDDRVVCFGVVHATVKNVQLVEIGFCLTSISIANLKRFSANQMIRKVVGGHGWMEGIMYQISDSHILPVYLSRVCMKKNPVVEARSALL